MKREPGRTESAGGDVVLEAARGRALIEESRELVIVLDAEQRVVAASRRAREQLEGLREGELVPERLLAPGDRRTPFTVGYEAAGRRETLLYLIEPGQLAAYEELRAGFTAAVSHELRTPLARLLAILEGAALPGSDPGEVVEQARAEVEQIRELIDDVLFLSELETGREVVGLGQTRAMPILRQLVEEHAERAARAGMKVSVEGDESIDVPLRPRMLRVIGENLLQNAIRYAGPGAALTLSISREGDRVVLAGSDTGVGVSGPDLPRLFERFYRTDRARASRGTGLGLAIVKHIVTQAGGSVEAVGARGEGLTIRCLLPGA
ncbi:MAG: ATP-binding protein [Gaiellales bacterium]